MNYFFFHIPINDLEQLIENKIFFLCNLKQIFLMSQFYLIRKNKLFKIFMETTFIDYHKNNIIKIILLNLSQGFS